VYLLISTLLSHCQKLKNVFVEASCAPRRDGEARITREVDDLISIFNQVDKEKCVSSLSIRTVCSNTFICQYAKFTQWRPTRKASKAHKMLVAHFTIKYTVSQKKKHVTTFSRIT